METPSLVLLSNQQAIQRSLDVIANNVANASTTGFKRESVTFDAYVSKSTSGSANDNVDFVNDRATYRDVSVGPIQSTGNSLDLAIQGQGYFSVRAADGSTKYTRSGSFQLDTKGQIVTQSGLPVLSDAGQPITIPDTVTDINIAGDGSITAKTDNGTSLADLGKIGVVTFQNEQDMSAEGSGLYSTKQVSAPSQDGTVIQGSLEQSNVQPITEMTQMLRIMRAYEQTTNLVSQENTRITTAINTLSKTTG